MSHKWPDISDYNLKLLYVDINGKRKIGFFPLGDSQSFSLSNEVKENLANNEYHPLLINGVQSFVKDDSYLSISEICKILPSYYNQKKITLVNSLEEILIYNPKVEFSSDSNRNDVSLNEFDLFMKSEFTPKHIRELHLECINALREKFNDKEISTLVSINEVKESFRDKGGDVNLLKRKRMECAFPFFMEYMRLKSLDKLELLKIEDSKVEEIVSILTDAVNIYVDNERVNRPHDFINLYNRNLHISGAKTMIDYLLSFEDFANKKLVKQDFMKKFGSTKAGVSGDFRFSLLSDKQRIHYKSPVITSLEKDSNTFKTQLLEIISVDYSDTVASDFSIR